MQQMDQPDVRPMANPLGPAPETVSPTSGNALGPDEAIDPVCGMKVNKTDAQYTANYEGQGQSWQTFYFCSDECKQLFERDPEKYANIP